MASSHARFTFDLDLASRPVTAAAAVTSAPPTPMVPEDLVAQLIAQAREEAYSEGVATG